MIDQRESRKTGRLLIFLLIMIFTLLLAACGDSGNGGSDGEDGGDTDSSSENSDVELLEADVEVLGEAANAFSVNIDSTDGETLFINLCAKCHGLGGLGDGPSAGSLQTQAGMNLTAVGEKSDEELLSTITLGKGVEMPAWGLILSLEQREAVLGYVRSLGE